MASRFIMPTADVGKGLTPSDGAKLSFFITGTSTSKDTFTTEAATTPNSNPVIADSNGVFPDIFITGTYKVTLTDKNDVQSGFGEADPVSETTGVGDSNNDKRYGPNFATVAAAVAANPVSIDGVIVNLVSGMSVHTIGRNVAGDVGAGTYLVQTAGEFGGTPDEVGDLTAANGTILVLQKGNMINAAQFNVFGSAGNKSTEINAAITSAVANKIGEVRLPNGEITAEGIQMKNGLILSGSGMMFGAANIGTKLISATAVDLILTGDVSTFISQAQIRDMALDGNSIGVNGINGFGFVNSSLIFNVAINNFTNAALFVRKSWDYTVSNCKFDGNAYGVRSGGTSGTDEVNNITFLETTCDGNSVNGYFLTGTGKGNKIIGGTVINNVGPGIRISDRMGSTTIDSYIEGNDTGTALGSRVNLKVDALDAFNGDVTITGGLFNPDGGAATIEYDGAALSILGGHFKFAANAPAFHVKMVSGNLFLGSVGLNGNGTSGFSDLTGATNYWILHNDGAQDPRMSLMKFDRTFQKGVTFIAPVTTGVVYDYAVDGIVPVLIVDMAGAAGSGTVQLPPPSAALDGLILEIKRGNAGGNSIVIATPAGQFIDDTSSTSFAMSAIFKGERILVDNANNKYWRLTRD
jgi:hypothetical protein